MRLPQRILTTLILAAGLSAAGSAAAADIQHGKQLVEKHCIRCHASMVGGDGSALYTRPNRRVHSLDGLHKQVVRCKDNLGITWFDSDVDDVVAYLNATYYKFK